MTSLYTHLAAAALGAAAAAAPLQLYHQAAKAQLKLEMEQDKAERLRQEKAAIQQQRDKEIALIETLAKRAANATKAQQEAARLSGELGDIQQRLLDAAVTTCNSDQSAAAASAGDTTRAAELVPVELYRSAEAEARELAKAVHEQRNAALTCVDVYNAARDTYNTPTRN